MITFEEAMEARKLPEVSELSASSLTAQDLVNLVLQRSEIIQDQPKANRFIKHWAAGNEAPIFQLVEDMGHDELLHRAAAFIYLEYRQLTSYLSSPKPRKIADIGCGYALFDLFLAKEHGTRIVLIDLENNDRRHFGFDDHGAAYSSLSQTRAFLVANGIENKLIETRNPCVDDLSDLKSLNYIFSFLSCGFHYPWDTYLDFYRQALSPKGRVILDFRTRRFPQVFPELAQYGYAKLLTMAAKGNATRVMLAREP